MDDIDKAEKLAKDSASLFLVWLRTVKRYNIYRHDGSRGPVPVLGTAREMVDDFGVWSREMFKSDPDVLKH